MSESNTNELRSSWDAHDAALAVARQQLAHNLTQAIFGGRYISADTLANFEDRLCDILEGVGV